jgi:hypothetical protein
MHHYSFPPKFITIIKQLLVYEDATCQVIYEGKLTEPFSIHTGVRQVCLLSPTIFLLVHDWIMQQATEGRKTGIQWSFTKQLEDWTLRMISAFSPTDNTQAQNQAV